MAIKDNKSNTEVVVLSNIQLTANGTLETGSIDTADYDKGVTFVPVYVAGSGAVTVTAVQESTTGTSGWTDVATSQLIGDLSDLVETGAVANGDVVNSLGVIGASRYLRLELTVTDFVTEIDYLITVNAGVEVAPSDS